MLYLCCVGIVYCINDESNPTPVYVVQGGEAVLQCGFDSNRLSWRVYSGDDANLVANDGLTVDGSKYSVSKNPSTGLYYRLHILNVGVSDVEKYRCSGLDNGVSRAFYLKLDILGRCTDMLVIFNPLDAKPFSRIGAKGLFSNLFTVTYQCKTSQYMT